MKHFDLFSGYGGFSLALEKVYGDNKTWRDTNNCDKENARYSNDNKPILKKQKNIFNNEDSKNVETSEDTSRALLQNGQEQSNTKPRKLEETKKNIKLRQPVGFTGNGYLSEKCNVSNESEILQSSRNKPDIESEQKQPITIGFSEIDKYASSVLRYRWPNTKNYGDIKKIDWSKVPDFDLLTGGSPCQDLSIAGKRAGLEGERSGLFYEYMRAVREKKPKYFIWENVKGALSSNKGFDFSAVINEMAEAGYSLWWQVLNAKDFGVPQNRERIFVVGFRDGSPREIFFEPGDDRQALKQIIPGSQGYRTYDPKGISVNIASQAGGVGAKTGLYAVKGFKDKEKDVANSLCATCYKGFGNDGVTMVEDQFAVTRGRSTEPWKESEIAPSRRLSDKDDIRVVQPVLTPDRLNKRQNGRRFKEDGEPSFTLTSQDRHGVLLKDILERRSDKLGRMMPVHRSKDVGIGRIRRLTPTECERLMGLPDNWTKFGVIDVPFFTSGKGIHQNYKIIEISDSQRYKLCGNGVVVNVVEEIIKKLILQL